MTTDLALIGSGKYAAVVTPLKTGGRRDVTVTGSVMPHRDAFAETDILRAFRQFFAAMDAEATERRDDPVALVQALARLETLAADVRAVRDSVKRLAAESLQAEKVRRLVVEGVAAVESTTEVKRSEWQHEELLGDLLEQAGYVLVATATGKAMHPCEAAPALLEWFRPEWKMTAIRQAGLDPDEYCRVQTDDDGKPVKTPTLRMLDNLVRRIAADS